MTSSKDRRLVAVMFTDVVGYTALMQRDEEAAKAVRSRHRRVVQNAAAEHGGEVVQLADDYVGDGSLSIFESALAAVRAAIEIQRGLQQDPVVPSQIGIHQGEVAYDTQGVYGDTVNVASRVQSLGTAGSVLVSSKVYDEIKNKPSISATSIGEFELKNVDQPIGIHAIVAPGLAVPSRDEILGRPLRSPPPGPRDLVGAVLGGRYKIIELLGEGGMGMVYLAEHIAMGRKTAIKVLHPEDLDADAIARFKRGSRNASRISHDNVCRVFEYGDPPGGLHFLAMEYVEGETLDAVLRPELRLSLRRAADIIDQTASGLQAAHDLGIIHRDLKPSNIMLTGGAHGREQVKVVDFDIAKGPPEAGEADLSGTWLVVGTPKYMSPEQFAGEELDSRSDIYSLGLIFFRILAGRSPFSATSPMAMMVERLSAEPMSLCDAAPDLNLPIEIQEVISRALRKDPHERWPSAAEFGAAALSSCESADSSPPAAPLADEGVTLRYEDYRSGRAPISVKAARSVDPSIPVTADLAAHLPDPAAPASSQTSSSRAVMYAVAVAVVLVAGGWGINELIISEGRPSASRPEFVERAPPPAVTPTLDPDATDAGGGEDPDQTVTELSGEAPDTPVEVQETGASAPVEPPAPRWTAISAEVRLVEIEDDFRQLIRLEEVPDSVALAAERVARDIYVFDLDDTEVQAHSAAVLARALGYLDRWDDAVTWISTALQLDSTKTQYRTLLTQFQNNR